MSPFDSRGSSHDKESQPSARIEYTAFIKIADKARQTRRDVSYHPMCGVLQGTSARTCNPPPARRGLRASSRQRMEHTLSRISGVEKLRLSALYAVAPAALKNSAPFYFFFFFFVF